MILDAFNLVVITFLLCAEALMVAATVYVFFRIVSEFTADLTAFIRSKF